jgi:hypothetical protein
MVMRWRFECGFVVLLLEVQVGATVLFFVDRSLDDSSFDQRISQLVFPAAVAEWPFATETFTFLEKSAEEFLEVFTRSGNVEVHCLEREVQCLRDFVDVHVDNSGESRLCVRLFDDADIEQIGDEFFVLAFALVEQVAAAEFVENVAVGLDVIRRAATGGGDFIHECSPLGFEVSDEVSGSPAGSSPAF